MNSFKLLLTLSVALAFAGCITPPLPPRLSKATQSPTPHTGDFWWGLSTSSYQNEDRAEVPGSRNYFKTDWDLFAEAGRVPPRGEEAVFSWSNFDLDLAALQRLGITHYRFGVEWARIEPEPGRYNEAALLRYVQMARKLRAAGIEPIVTLWHFTMPSWLVTPRKPGRSRWLHPLFRERWAAYTQKVTRALAPHVRIFVPQNEPNGDLALGYLSTVWPPGLFLSFGNYQRALEESIWAFRQAAETIRAARKDALVLSVHALPYWRRTFWDPTQAYYNFMQRINFTHLDRVFDLCDLIGFNYYYTEYADFSALLALKVRRGHNYSLLGWVIQPRSLYQQIQTVTRRYRKPVVITENGIATVKDVKRVRYLFNHALEVRDALADGYDVRGYFVWTLVDNYEWHHGWSAPFGLSRMEPRTRRRLLRPSALFYSGLVRSARESELLDQISTTPELPLGLIER